MDSRQYDITECGYVDCIGLALRSARATGGCR